MAARLYQPEHKCGIGAAVNTDTPLQDLFWEAISTQNRGYDGCGFSIYDLDAHAVRTYKGPGKVSAVFSVNLQASQIRSDRGIFNNRYRTTGDTNLSNVQPVTTDGFAVSHNGNVFNYRSLAERYGINTSGNGSDTGAIAEIIRQSGSIENGIRSLAEEALGAFNLAVIDANGIVGVYRDPWGYHPLFAGRKGKSIYFASEEPGIYALKINEPEELRPGDLWLTDGPYTEKFSIRPSCTKSGIPIKESMCSFELPYFMRPGGRFNGLLGSKFREEAGGRLAERDGFPNDGRHIVIPILNSGRHYAAGYSRRSGIRVVEGFLWNTDMSRLYMEEDKMAVLGITPQEMAVRKNMVVPRNVMGKKVIVADDSIVRAGTVPGLIKDLFDAGAEEVHVRIGTPPVISPCRMGLNHSDRTKLRAPRAVVDPERAALEEIEEKVRVSLDPRLSSLHYLPLKDFKELLGDENNHCFGCFTGAYPLPITNEA